MPLVRILATLITLASMGAACVSTDSGSAPSRESSQGMSGGSTPGMAPDAPGRRVVRKKPSPTRGVLVNPNQVGAPRPLRARPSDRVKTASESAPVGSAAREDAPTAVSAGDQMSSVFVDRFERSSLGADWTATSPAWRLESGRLCARGARNHPVWLARRLPQNARIEFDAVSDSPDGDIKAEIWGDGRSAAQGVTYDDASGYVAILGGWRNQFHVLAKHDEHAPDRLQTRVDPSGENLRALPVARGHTYAFKIERNDGRTIRWLVDDIEVFVFSDPDPLAGPGHEHLGFNDWEVPVCFDNLIVTPLESE